MRKAGLPGRARVLGYVLVMVGPLGCSDDRVRLPGAESSTGEPSSGSTTTSGSSSTSATSSTTGLADDTTGLASTGEPEVIFVPIPDVGEDDDCDIFAQDCPPGLKCTAWNSKGETWGWNATSCKPVVDDPVGIDETCHVVGSGYSGIDDCPVGAMCWDVDPKTNQGVCVPFCVGSEDTWVCEDPMRQCFACGDFNNCAWRLCLPVCDPLDQDCPEGQACYWLGNAWGCGPDASGDAGANGDPCDFINECDPGLVCLLDSGVCSEVCDLDDMQCAGAIEGQVCLPWYEDGEAPPGYEDLGVCTLPQ